MYIFLINLLIFLFVKICNCQLMSSIGTLILQGARSPVDIIIINYIIVIIIILLLLLIIIIVVVVIIA